MEKNTNQESVDARLQIEMLENDKRDYRKQIEMLEHALAAYSLYAQLEHPTEDWPDVSRFLIFTKH